MKTTYIYILLFIFSLCASSAAAQIDGFGLRTNLLPWFFGSPSFGADFSWNTRYFLVLDGNYGDWDVSEGDKRVRHSSAGIELRRYFSNGSANWFNPNGDKYRGMYLGIDGRYTKFNSTFTSTGKEGVLITTGLVAGYTFRLRGNWAVDASIGAGYLRKDYNKYEWYPPAGMDRMKEKIKKNTFDLTNLSVALVYRFNK